ncbi:hypothetical protein GCM10010123_18470 [Pilimelia anulata]|uniref:DUF6458 domain-containing protein n=1 Tax=Pilimelia anulata TaxID=53371 RepID=A0A8J3F8R1_9ACTN|nr:DUF6458 family protein [Pilimelia anulata]GGJ89195.1 hypothetical protein GCM10010123_18470 [Pilimelia anulata]
MGIGGSIFLIAIGAILSFAVEYRLGWLDINVVGWVLMLAGLAALCLTIAYSRRTRRTVAAGNGRVVQQTDIREPDPRL